MTIIAPELRDADVGEEGNLLVEAVSLLVQRQRETETWIAEQLRQSEQAAAQTERRYAELEERLARIEQRLAGLVRRFDPSTAAEGQLTRLREQVVSLSHGSNGLSPRQPTIVGLMTEPARSSAVAPIDSARPAVAASTESARPAAAMPIQARQAPPPASAPIQPPPATRPVAFAPAEQLASREFAEPSAAVPTGPVEANGGLLAALGNTPAERIGVLLMGAGGIAVLYTLLTQLGFS